MRIRSLVVVATYALGAMSAGAAQAQSTSGYWSGSGTWKNSSGQCWRGGYWTPAMANSECDPDLVPKPAPVAPPVVAPRAAPPPPPPPPVVQPAPPKPSVVTATLTEQFPPNKATLTPAMRAKIDSEVVAKVNGLSRVDLVHISGHTDRLGSQQYNQKLSEKRADAVAAYLVSKGVPKDKIETIGMGKTLAVKSCPDQKNRKALNECLAPNRRVEVEIRGMPK